MSEISRSKRSNLNRRSKSKRKIKRNKNFINKYFRYDFMNASINYYLIIALAVLSIFGLFILLSASSYLTIKYDLNNYYYLIRQGVGLVIGFIIMILISKINYRIYYDYANVLYIISIILLIMCYIPFFSVRTNSARRSIKLLITFMPSDVAKPILIMMISKFLIKNKDNNDFLKTVIPAIFIIVIPFALVLFQTDLSTSLVIFTSSSLVFLIYSMKLKFLPAFGLIAVSGVFALFKLLKPYQLNRLTAFLDLEGNYGDLSWQTLNSIFAVSRGGAFGVGYGKSVYKLGYLADEVINDMIFAVVGEEFGFIGSVIFVILVATITFLIINESLKCKDRFGKLLSFGIGMIYFVQSMINIGVSISLIPNTGITLPFVSNGVSSIFAFSFMFGIVLNISRKNNYDLNINQKKNKKIN